MCRTIGKFSLCWSLAPSKNGQEQQQQCERGRTGNTEKECCARSSRRRVGLDDHPGHLRQSGK